MQLGGSHVPEIHQQTFPQGLRGGEPLCENLGMLPLILAVLNRDCFRGGGVL